MCDVFEVYRMRNIMAFVMSLIFAVALTTVVGFVIASIKGYSYEFTLAVPIGLGLGVILYFFGTAVLADQK
jgi:hypothetical protein